MKPLKWPPLDWTCIRCKKTFTGRLGMNDQQPYGFEIARDNQGLQKRGGDICKECYEKGGAA